MRRLFWRYCKPEKRMQESLTTMQTLEDKHKRIYPTAKEDVHPKEKAKRKQKQIKEVPDWEKTKLPKSVFCSSCKLIFIWR